MLQFSTDEFTYYKDTQIFVQESSMLELKPQFWNSLRREPVDTAIMLSNPETEQTSVFYFTEADMSPGNEVVGWNYKNKKGINLLIIND